MRESVMRSSPLPSLSLTTRIFIKALIVVALANVVALAVNFNPIAALTRFNLWWLTGHGRNRLAYPSDFQNGQLPVETLLSSHAIAYTPKAENEYRVAVLGESGIAGWGLRDQDTFVGQLNSRHLTLDSRQVVAYNLAYPSPNVARDTLILDAALAYHPDLVIWFITPAALDDSPDALGTNTVFFELNRQRLQRITYDNQLQNWYNARLNPLPIWQSWIAVHNQDTLPVWFNTLLYPFTEPDYSFTERRIGSEPIPAKARYTAGRKGFDPMPNETWRFLDIARTLTENAHAKLLLINEPMLIGKGQNSDVNYNLQYQRQFYDTYRQKITDYAAQQGFLFADLWDVIPAESFTDTPLHADAAGYAKLVDKITSELLKLGDTG